MAKALALCWLLLAGVLVVCSVSMWLAVVESRMTFNGASEAWIVPGYLLAAAIAVELFALHWREGAAQDAD